MPVRRKSQNSRDREACRGGLLYVENHELKRECDFGRRTRDRGKDRRHVHADQRLEANDVAGEQGWTATSAPVSAIVTADRPRAPRTTFLVARSPGSMNVDRIS